MATRETGNHVLDELLAQSVQVGRGRKAASVGKRSERAAGAAGWPDLMPEEDARDVPEVHAPAPRAERHIPFQGLEGAEQVGRGPLALHLSRAATEEKLAEAYTRAERLEQSLAEAAERMTELRERLRESDRRMAEREGRDQALEQELERLRSELELSAGNLQALQGRIQSSEDSERTAHQEQLRALAVADERKLGIESLRQRAAELDERLAAERVARGEADAEVARLRGSIRAIVPLVSGLERATSALQSEPPRATHSSPVSPEPAGPPAAVAERPAVAQPEPVASAAAAELDASPQGTQSSSWPQAKAALQVLPAQQPVQAAPPEHRSPAPPVALQARSAQQQSLAAEVRASASAPAPAEQAVQEQRVRPFNPPQIGAATEQSENSAQRPTNPGLMRVLGEAAAQQWQGPGPRPAESPE